MAHIMKNELVQANTQSEVGQLVEEHFNCLSRGCGPAAVDLVTGKTGRRMQRISDLTGLDGEHDVSKLFAGVSLICMGSGSKEEASQKIRETFVNSTKGEESTGNALVDQRIKRTAILAKEALDVQWKIKERRMVQGRSR